MNNYYCIENQLLYDTYILKALAHCVMNSKYKNEISQFINGLDKEEIEDIAEEIFSQDVSDNKIVDCKMNDDLK